MASRVQFAVRLDPSQCYSAGMRISDDQRDWLTLAMVPGVGSAHFIRLLARFRTPGAVLRASRGMLAEVVSANLARRIHTYGEEADISGQESAMEAADAHLITMEDKAYPERLAEIYDPPLLLFVRGEIRPEDERCVAIVGTRRATPYGIRMAEQFGRDLAAAGITVVSGLAAGVDAAAHRGALEAGGRTIAVLGCGVDVVYPRENESLMKDITRQGAVVSQFVMGCKPNKGNFPVRNRIISGLTLGTLIIEAPIRSGALITARNAAEQGREVFAIPGQIGVQNSQGPHSLIRQGAKLVESVDDIISELPALAPVAQPSMVHIEEAERATAPRPAPRPQLAPQPKPAVANASSEERKVLSVLTPDGAFIDDIAQRCRLSIAESLRALTVLELKGMVRQFSGKRFAPK